MNLVTYVQVGYHYLMDFINKEKRLNEIYKEASLLEKNGQTSEALTLWREALVIKNELGISGAGDILELNAIQDKIDKLV